MTRLEFATRPFPACVWIAERGFAMSETKDIARRRLNAFLAARLRARLVEQKKAQGANGESIAVSSPRPSERAAPANEA
jgi:hypothetical protein